MNNGLQLHFPKNDKLETPVPGVKAIRHPGGTLYIKEQLIMAVGDTEHVGVSVLIAAGCPPFAFKMGMSELAQQAGLIHPIPDGDVG